MKQNIANIVYQFCLPSNIIGAIAAREDLPHGFADNKCRFTVQWNKEPKATSEKIIIILIRHMEHILTTLIFFSATQIYKSDQMLLIHSKKMNLPISNYTNTNYLYISKFSKLKASTII